MFNTKCSLYRHWSPVWPLYKTQNVKIIIKNHLKTHHKKFGINTTLTKEQHCLAKVPIKVTLLTSTLSSCGLIYVTWNNKNLQKENVTVIIIIMNYCWDIKMIVVIISRVRRVKCSSFLCHKATEEQHNVKT